MARLSYPSLTEDDRERHEERRLSAALELLEQIRSELCTEGFTVREVRNEFESQAGSSRDSVLNHSAEKQLPILEEAGYIEKIGKQRYRFTLKALESE